MIAPSKLAPETTWNRVEGGGCICPTATRGQPRIASNTAVEEVIIKPGLVRVLIRGAHTRVRGDHAPLAG